MTWPRCRLVAVAGLLSISIGVAAQTPSGAVYRPALRPPEFLEPFAPKLEAGHDAFTAEPIAAAIEARLRAFGEAWRLRRPGTTVDSLLAPDARGETVLRTGAEPGGALTVQRATGPTRPADRKTLDVEFTQLLGLLGTLTVAEFDVIAVEVRMPAASSPPMSGSTWSASRASPRAPRPTARGGSAGARTRWAGGSSSGRRSTWQRAAPHGRSSPRSPRPRSAAPRRSAVS